MLFLLISNTSVNGEGLKDIKIDYLTIGSGFEYLSYTEYEPETDTFSDTTTYNVVTKFNGRLSMEGPLFFEFKGMVPVYTGEVKEDWKRHGSIYQTNNLKFNWSRIDSNIGYSIYSWLNPCMGLRWSKSIQKRTGFFTSAPISLESFETCRALFVSAGLAGNIRHSPRWEFGYSFEYFMPVSVRTKNTALRGWKSRAKEGYSLGARAVARYIYSPSVLLYYELSGERSYWDGSNWIDYPGGSAKWPENETLSLNYILGVAWLF